MTDTNEYDTTDEFEYNHDQPHEVVHESAIKYARSGDETHKRIPVIANLCMYQLDRRYGGPEEGGWWYDTWEFTGIVFPFRAEQDYEYVEWDDEQGNPTSDENQRFRVDWDEERNKWMFWRAAGLPHVLDEPTRVLLQSARTHYETIFGPTDTNYRSSVVPRGEDYRFIYEVSPGDAETRVRPRYC